MNVKACLVCGAATELAGKKFGKYAKTWFELLHCPSCRFSFVANPWTDFTKIYSDAYYEGRGADPLVNYQFELDHPTETIRISEWEGIVQVVSRISSLHPESLWMDFGCGNGGLVRHVMQSKLCNVIGFDEGSIVKKAVKLGIPILNRERLEDYFGQCDVVTAVEVLEHVVDPVETLRLIVRLLKPGGVLFLTTGNARPFRRRLSQWTYVVPEIHISFFEPETIAFLMKKVGLLPEHLGFVPGFEKIIHYKVLKSLGVCRRSFWENLIPIDFLSRFVDGRYGISKHPVGRLVRKSAESVAVDSNLSS